MNKFRLIVKGSAAIAKQAAVVHGLYSVRIASESRTNESTGLIAEGKTADVVDWFVEDLHRAPFKKGSLLWYKGVA